MEDAQLIQGLLDGDETAQASLNKLYRPRLLATAAHFLGPKDPEVEDLVQETFTRALGGLKGFEARSSLYTWLNHICVNLCYERFRHRKKMVMAESEDLELMLAANAGQKFAAGDEEMARSFRLAQLRELISRLKPACSEILKLRFVEGLELARIKDKLKIPLGTVASRLARCLDSLKREAKEHKDA